MTIRRRQIVSGLGAVILLGGLGSFNTLAARKPPNGSRTLKLLNLQTGERFSGAYFEHDYLPDALAELNHVLRDYINDDEHHMDHRLFDWMVSLRDRLGGGEYRVICGYRSASTNKVLMDRKTGAVKGSLHLYGKAIDLRLSGVETAELRKFAVSDRRGGVGYYADRDFVHIDTGRVRYW